MFSFVIQTLLLQVCREVKWRSSSQVQGWHGEIKAITPRGTAGSVLWTGCLSRGSKHPSSESLARVAMVTSPLLCFN